MTAVIDLLAPPMLRYLFRNQIAQYPRRKRSGPRAVI